MANRNPNPDTRFKPGNRAASGRPAGARNKVTKQFLEALSEDFDQHGAGAIAAAREADPVGYMRVVASLVPKEFTVERPLESLTDDELAAAIEMTREAMRRDAERDGDADPGGKKRVH